MRGDEAFVARLHAAAVASETVWPKSTFVALQIYDDYIQDWDEDVCRRFHAAPWAERLALVDRFRDVRLKKLARRLYREEKLQVRRRGGRKRALGTRQPMLVPDRVNLRWSLDFVSDAFTDGRRFRVLAVVDDFSRECLALVVDTSLSGLRVTRELDEIMAVRGKPSTDLIPENWTV